MSRKHMMRITIKDCEVQAFRAGGPGGQKQNKTSSAARVIHHPSGARAESRRHRSFHRNRRDAFVRMAESPEFRRWVDLQHARMEGDIDAQVKEWMLPRNLIVETYDPGEETA